MPVICIGPVCIPLAAIAPLLVLLLRPIYDFLLRTPLAKYLPQPRAPHAPEEEPAGSPIVVIKSEEQWEELHTAAGTLVAQFTATWCGPCKRVAPVYAQLARAHARPGGGAGGVTFCKVDIDAVASVADECNVSSVPQFHVFRNGECIDKVVGASAGKLEAVVQKHCSPAKAAAAAGGGTKQD